MHQHHFNMNAFPWDLEINKMHIAKWLQKLNKNILKPLSVNNEYVFTEKGEFVFTLAYSAPLYSGLSRPSSQRPLFPLIKK